VSRFISNNSLFKHIKLWLFKKLWRKMNKHNFTEAGNCFNRRKVTIGRGTYGTLNVRHFGNDNERLTIGHFCSIGPNVCFLLGGEHEYKKVSTYPFKKMYLTNENESITKGEIVVEDDVWIGYGSVILSGVKIGRGAIIGANSVVTKDIEPYAIYAGNRIVKYRFSPKIIEALKRIDYSKINEENIINIQEYLEKELDESNVDNIVEQIIKIIS